MSTEGITEPLPDFIFDFGACTDQQLLRIVNEHKSGDTRRFAAEELRARRIRAQATALLPAIRSANQRIEDPRKAANMEIHMPAGECHALLILAELALRDWKIEL